MKLRLTKKSISHFLEYNWFIVLGCLILSYATFYVSLNKIHAFKDHEKVDFFIEGKYIIDRDLEYELIDNIEGLYEINYHIAPSQSKKLYTLYEGYFDTSDIYILREKDFLDMQHIVKDQFININNDFISRILGDLNINLDYYSYENNNYAIKIYDYQESNSNKQLHFNNFIEFDLKNENYYMAFNKDSLKFSLTKESNSIALDTVSYLFRRYFNG